MLTNQRRTRSVALLTGGVLAASVLLQGSFFAAPAQADKSKTYKVGAVVLGAASVYLLLKGKTLPGALAGAGAYYAYKKSKDAKDDEYSRYPDQYPDGRYSRGTDVYPNDAGNSIGQYPDYGNYGYGALVPNANSRTLLK